MGQKNPMASERGNCVAGPVRTSVGRHSAEGGQSGRLLGWCALDGSGKGKEGAEDSVLLRKEQDLRLEGREHKVRSAHATEHRLGFKFGEVKRWESMGLRILKWALRIGEVNGIPRRIGFYFGRERSHEYAGLPS